MPIRFMLKCGAIVLAGYLAASAVALFIIDVIV